MTSAAAPTPVASRKGGMARLAAGMAAVCLALFLLAIEQRHAVAAWSTITNDTVPAVANAMRWAADGGPGGLSGLKDTVSRGDGTLTADSHPTVLAGEFDPIDDATRDAVGSATFVGATIRLEKGETFRTQPLRIASGREAMVSGQTFAQGLEASPDAQIELRRIVPLARSARVIPSALCGGEVPGVVALLHRRDRIDLVIFRERIIVGNDAPPSAICGAWRFRGR